MEPDKPRNTKSVTRTTEYGYFIRKKIRRGKKKRQKTTKIEPKGEKVVIGKLNDLEIYVYPHDYPDKVFLGIYPLSTVIGEEDLSKLLGIYNKIRWYLNEEWTRTPKTEKGAKYLRRRLKNSYNKGLDKRKEAKK